MNPFHPVFLKIADKHAPRRTIRVRNKPSPWITSEIKQQMLFRDKLKKKAIKSNIVEDWKTYKIFKNKLNKQVKYTKRRFYKQEIEKKSGDSKGTWKILNDLMNRKSKNTQISEIKISPLEITSNPKEIANHLNKHFTEIGIKLASEIPDSPNDITFKSYLTKTNTVFKLQR